MPLQPAMITEKRIIICSYLQLAGESAVSGISSSQSTVEINDHVTPGNREENEKSDG